MVLDRLKVTISNSGTEKRNMEILDEVETTAADIEDEPIRPLSGRPYFHIIVQETHLRPNYQLVIPIKMHPLLPSSVLLVLLVYKGKSWEIAHVGRDKTTQRFAQNWKEFAIENRLKTGDACLFELIDCNNSIPKFSVQIFRGDLPPKLLHKVNVTHPPSQPLQMTNGDTFASPILIE